MFNKKKKLISSQIAISLSYKISINEKEINQTQYITENYVYTGIGDKKMIYLPNENKQYLIDVENKLLKELDLSVQLAQMNQLKELVGEVKIDEYNKDQIKHISIQNNLESSARLKVDLQITQNPGLEKTVFQKSNEFQQSMQMFRTELKSNEIVSFSESIFSINGQEQKSTLTLTRMEKEKEGVEMTDKYFNYKIKK